MEYYTIQITSNPSLMSIRVFTVQSLWVHAYLCQWRGYGGVLRYLKPPLGFPNIGRYNIKYKKLVKNQNKAMHKKITNTFTYLIEYVSLNSNSNENQHNHRGNFYKLGLETIPKIDFMFCLVFGMACHNHTATPQ